MTSLRSLALPVLVLATSLAACAAPNGDEAADDAVDTASEALTSCGAAQYNAALAHYKNAVAWSKDRLANGACGSESGLLWSIADEASRAVTTCSAFRTTIRTSPWAAPLRTALAPSLTLESLTGELLVIKDSSWQNWTGTDRFFARGVSFWARAEGAYGAAVRVDFRANGQATWGELVHDAATGDITWRETHATYTLTKASESGARTVTVEHAGKTASFRLGVQNGAAWSDAPLFVLTPQGTTPAPALFSLVSECDA